MNKIKLNLLLDKYKKEVSHGEYSHLKDMIGASIIADLVAKNDYFIEYHNLYDLTLTDFIYPYFKPKDTSSYTVPSRYELAYEKDALKRLKKAHEYNERRTAANTWLDLMVTTGIVNEGQQINPDEYRLEDYIVDNNLRDILPLPYFCKMSDNLRQLIEEKYIKKLDKRNK